MGWRVLDGAYKWEVWPCGLGQTLYRNRALSVSIRLVGMVKSAYDNCILVTFLSEIGKISTSREMGELKKIWEV